MGKSFSTILFIRAMRDSWSVGHKSGVGKISLDAEKEVNAPAY